MIIADQSVWSAVLRGRSRAMESLLTDLLARGELATPGLVFAHLVAEAEDGAEASRLRTWAGQLPPLDEPIAAWLAAGDLAAHLADAGTTISLLDAYLVTLCLREDCALWSYNPRFEEVARQVPLRRFLPSGVA